MDSMMEYEDIMTCLCVYVEVHACMCVHAVCTGVYAGADSRLGVVWAYWAHGSESC